MYIGLVGAIVIILVIVLIVFLGAASLMARTMPRFTIPRTAHCESGA